MRKSRFMLAASVFLLPTLGCDPCENEVASAVASPSGDRTAVIFSRSCGATTRVSTQVSILRSAEPPSEAGNVLVLDDSSGTLPTLPTGGPRVEARWLASDHLELRYSRQARVFTAGTAFEQIRVTHARDST